VELSGAITREAASRRQRQLLAGTPATDAQTAVLHDDDWLMRGERRSADLAVVA
jgi:hypothetical protein